MGFATKSSRIVLAIFGLFLRTAPIQAQEDAPLTPPLVPQGEQVVPDDADFIDKCMAHIPKTLGIEIAATLTTQSGAWGLVWRADFTIPKSAKMTGVNRIVCRQARGDEPLNFALATGQEIPPLAPK
jgi:hypothetical protein